MTEENHKKVIVFGSTGAIGTSLIEILSEKQPSWEIIAVSRSGDKCTSRLSQLSLPNVKLVAGDIENLTEVQELCQTVNIVYCTVGFAQYERVYWAKHWPIVVGNLLAVTDESKPLVFCDNLYAYGPDKKSLKKTTTQTVISVSSPKIAPSNKSKPAIRSLMHESFQSRMDKSPQSIVVVGGADFFGPHVTDKSFLGNTFVGNMVQSGSKPLAIGSADVIHTFCYAKDFANAMYVASVEPTKAYGKFWICPHTIQNKTLRNIAADVNGLLSKKVEGIQVISPWMVTVLGYFMGFMAEMKEMLPFWTKDYIVDDSAFVEAFGITATPYEQALKETVEFFQSKEE